MPKPDKPKHEPVKSSVKPEPSKPIDQKEKNEKEVKTKAKTKQLENLLDKTDVPTTGQITAGTWVADFDNINIRKNTLRLGE